MSLWAAVFIIPFAMFFRGREEVPELPIPSEGIGAAENVVDSDIEVTVNIDGKVETLPLFLLKCVVFGGKFVITQFCTARSYL